MASESVLLDGVFKADVPSIKPLIRPQRKITSIDEEFDQIRKCRYIRKTPSQRKDSSSLDLDISFLRHHNKREIAPVKEEEVGEVKELIKEQSSSKEQQNKDQNSFSEVRQPPPVPEETKPPVKPKEPFVPQRTKLTTGREKMIPLVLSDFNSKCTITSSSTNHQRQLKKRPVSKRNGKKLDSLYKEISAAAKNADVDLSNVVRGVRDEQKKVHQWEKMRKSDQSLKRWNYVSSLVRSGWLLGKRGRSLKMMEDRIRKRRLYETNLGTLPISYQASLRKSERTAAHASLFQRKLGATKSEPNFPAIHSRMRSGRANSLPALHVANRTIISRDSKRKSNKLPLK